ncbi:Translation machinery-associated protein 46 [Malassezia sp. CBS 17886]|nr:Translation machinery-associated protein 46 [Malassezia sp. CBS 17886]
MAPKKKAGGGSGGAAKVQVDKTFGMKNKKGGKAQKEVKVIHQQQSQAGLTREQLAKQKRKEDDKRLKAEEEKRIKSEGPLLGVVQPKVPFGVDPKSITCAFWKAGRCEKGSKCKFAHSSEQQRNNQKMDLYTDMREEKDDEKKNDTMDKWDQERLANVIAMKHGNPRTTTDKVCKFFLQAVEDGKYGWFWECPNGAEKCMYRHRLPPGFVLKSERKEKEALEKANEISLEEFIESARHKLGSNLTPVTPESFATWRKERLDKKLAEDELHRQKKATQAHANRMAGLSGREMFALNPDMLAGDDDDDDGAFDMATYMQAGWEQDRQDDPGAAAADGVAAMRVAE